MLKMHESSDSERKRHTESNNIINIILVWFLLKGIKICDNGSLKRLS